MSLKLGTTDIAGLQTNKILTGWNIFDCKWSDHIINDIQWLRADTFSWQSGDVYVTAYNKLVEEYSTGSEETEGSITFKRTTNGFKIADSSQESAILSKYNTDGIAWYYILDTTNKQFKLPRTKFGFEGLRDNVGDDISESLPNIKGTENVYVRYNSASGAFKLDDSSSGTKNASGTTYTASNSLTFDASRSSSTYQDNAPVQERATQMYLYFYVGEYSQTAIEQTAGLNSELFNGKLDITSAQAQAPYLKTTYVNGTSGYNIWSNGYCEQWGKLVVNSSSVSGSTYSSTTLTFIKPFNKLTSYYVQARHDRFNAGFASDVIGTACTSTTVYQVNDSSTAFTNPYVVWKACGYLADGEY